MCTCRATAQGSANRRSGDRKLLTYRCLHYSCATSTCLLTHGQQEVQVQPIDSWQLCPHMVCPPEKLISPGSCSLTVLGLWSRTRHRLWISTVSLSLCLCGLHTVWIPFLTTFCFVAVLLSDASLKNLSVSFPQDAQIEREKQVYNITGGCTALTVVYLLGKLYVGNAGDSRCVCSPF